MQKLIEWWDGGRCIARGFGTGQQDAFTRLSPKARQVITIQCTHVTEEEMQVTTVSLKAIRWAIRSRCLLVVL